MLDCGRRLVIEPQCLPAIKPPTRPAPTQVDASVSAHTTRAKMRRLYMAPLPDEQSEWSGRAA
jgi:hypothetical protein